MPSKSAPAAVLIGLCIVTACGPPGPPSATAAPSSVAGDAAGHESPTAGADVDADAGTGTEAMLAYRSAAWEAVLQMNGLTRELGRISVDVGETGRHSNDHLQTMEETRAGYGEIGARMGGRRVPAGHEPLHEDVLGALELYSRALAALWPDSHGNADLFMFQTFVVEGNKRADDAIAELSR